MLYFALGDFVHHPDRPDWGIGQVQSIVGMHVTVNFTHAGKQMINCEIIELEKTDPRPQCRTAGREKRPEPHRRVSNPSRLRHCMTYIAMRGYPKGMIVGLE